MYCKVDWNNVHVTLNEKEINLPISIVIPLANKIKTMTTFQEKRFVTPIHHAEAKEILVQFGK